MRLSEVLTPEAISLALQARSKSEALDELVGLLEQGHGVDSGGEILERVRRREAMMSTGVGLGVAIPHGKTGTTPKMLAACAVSRAGVDYESVDGQPVHLFVLFVSPENNASQHIRVLGNTSRLLKEESVRRELREAESPEAFLEVIRSAESAFTA
jgi:mannitol/fructose-specific phosphotransferase system IIA component (Ntr-type)